MFAAAFEGTALPEQHQGAGVKYARPFVKTVCLSVLVELPFGRVVLPIADEGRALSEQHEGAGAEEDCDALCPDAHEGDQPARS